MSEKGLRTFFCAECGRTFEATHKRRFCCVKCRERAYATKKRGGLLPKLQKRSRRGICLQCGNLTGIRWTTFCSRECAFEYDRIQAEYKQFERQKISELRKTARKLTTLLKAIRDIKKAEERVTSCIVCGKLIRWHMGRAPLYCSQECEKESEAFKRGRRVWRASRRAREKRLPYQSIDPMKVFERDGWFCQLCGRSTPKEKRGTREPDAPELDHIKPLSKGGYHVWNNVQCLCRQCNQQKGDSEG